MAKNAGELKIEYFPIEKLKPYERNARTHGKDQVGKIVASIKTFGWTKPIIVDEKHMVLAGHGALAAAKMMNLVRVPVIVRKGLTRTQKRAYIVADNKIAEESGWDLKALRFELGDLSKLGFDMTLTGFNPVEITNLIDPAPPSQERGGKSKIVHECPNCHHKFQS